jgi:hypothetical protein
LPAEESQLPAADDATIARAEAAVAATNGASFVTSATVHGSSYGLTGDGVTNNTEAFRQLMSVGDRTIYIDRGDYVTGKFTIPRNTILILENGTIIRDSGELDIDDRLINIPNDNVYISAAGARVIAERADYTSGEFRHGVYIDGAQNVVIEGLESSSHGGDGFYVGGEPGDPAADIILKGCRADNNRRQGLSIVSARRVHIADCEFMNTNGTAPQFGVDLEPDAATQALDEIVFLRPQTLSNVGGGIMIQLRNLDATSEPVSVMVIDHFSQAEVMPFRAAETDGVPAVIYYNHAR